MNHMPSRPHTPAPADNLREKVRVNLCSKARAKANSRENIAKRVNQCTLYGRAKVKARVNQHSRAQEPHHFRHHLFPVSRIAQQTTPALLTIQVRQALRLSLSGVISVTKLGIIKIIVDSTWPSETIPVTAIGCSSLPTCSSYTIT